MKVIVLSQHAIKVAEERDLSLQWIEQGATSPEWVAPDPDDPTVERRFRTIPERDGRILRVACRESDNEIFVVTAFLDRRARRPQ